MPDKQPDILFIFSDQHSEFAMGCSGDPNADTPNLDRLASEGIRFTNAYSNTPICAPFRACLYTGQYITTHGVNCLFKPLLPNQPVLAEVMRGNGYHTSHMGKWHLTGGDCPSHFVSPYFRPGWDEWMGWDNSNRPFKTEYGKGPMPFPVYTMEGYQTDVITDMTIDWIRNYTGDKPWFHVMSFEPPHPPNEAPEKYMEMYRDRELIYRENFAHDHEKRDDFEKRLRGYYAQIKNMDDNIGRIMKTLEETGCLDNTIIFYFSDHGDMNGSHGLVHKSRPEEESANIPLIIRYPELVPQGNVTDALISTVDFMPSLLSLIGIEIPDSVEGEDLSSAITGESETGADEILIQFDRNFFDYPENHDSHVRTVRTGDWKYTVHYYREQSRMFNLKDDPYEMKNLIDSPEHAEIRSRLHARLQKKLDEIGDTFELE
jgi:arylsulfatase A-like enzyme